MLRVLISAILLCVAGAALAQGNYTVRPGDQLAIEVLEDPSLNRNVLVLPDGRFSFPFAGVISATGRTTAQVAREIESALSPNFAAPPTVFVSVANLFNQDLLPEAGGTTIEVFLIGEVSQPGAIDVEQGTTLLQFLARSGGFTRFAATKRIQLRRINPSSGASQLFTLNFKALANGAPLTQDITLAEGDVVIVPERRLFE